VINSDPKVKVIFVNVFGASRKSTRSPREFRGSLSRHDHVAVVLRLDGTNAVEGRAILASHLNDKLMMEPTMLDAARRAVAYANA